MGGGGRGYLQLPAQSGCTLFVVPLTAVDFDLCAQSGKQSCFPCSTPPPPFHFLFPLPSAGSAAKCNQINKLPVVSYGDGTRRRRRQTHMLVQHSHCQSQRRHPTVQLCNSSNAVCGNSSNSSSCNDEHAEWHQTVSDVAPSINAQNESCLNCFNTAYT